MTNIDSKINIGKVGDLKKNNFHFLRFLFSIFVLVSHGYPLSGDHESSQWIYEISNGQIVLASLGLNGFFVISGFFIYQSLLRSNNIFNYFVKRFLRLFPALLVVLLLTVMLVPFVYNNEIPLLKNIHFYTYVPYNLSLYGFQPKILGVFDHNSYHAINGSLWTLRYEFSLYIALALLYLFRKQKKIIIALLFLSVIILILVYNFFMQRFAWSSLFGMQGFHILNFGAFFVVGSLLASLNFDAIQSKSKLFIIGFVLITLSVLIVSVHFNYYNAFKHILFPFLILSLGYMPIPLLVKFAKLGDASYGIYIYSFPVSQTLMYFFILNTQELIIISLVISIFFGYLSWHLIEKYALKYKNRFNFNFKTSE